MIKTSVRPIKLKAARNSVGNKLLILCLPSSMPNLLMRQQQGILNFGPEVLSFLGILRIGYIRTLDQSSGRRLVVEKLHLITQVVLDRCRCIQVHDVFLHNEFTATGDLNSQSRSHSNRIRSSIHVPDHVAPNDHLAEQGWGDKTSIVQSDCNRRPKVRRCRYKLEDVVLDHQTPRLP